MTEEQQKVLNALMSYYEAHKGEKRFYAKTLVEHMEPVFTELGFRKEIEPGTQPKILVLRDDAAGDFVLGSAFLRELRRVYPKAHITLFGSKRNDEIARCCPYTDNLLVNGMEFESEDFWVVFKAMAPYVVEHLLPYHFDLAFSGRLGVYSADVLIMYLAGARARVAYTQDRMASNGKIARIGWDVLLSHAVPLRRRVESDADRDLFLLEYLLQLPVADRRLEMWELASDREAAEQAIEPLIKEKKVKRLYAIMLSASEVYKAWPSERFEQLLKTIMQKEKDVGLVVLGGPADSQVADAFAARFPHKAISLAGRLPFRVSAAVLGRCEKYIGNDTGLMHMAAAHGLPVLTVFTFPASLGLYPMSCPVRFQPYGVPSVAVLPAEAKEERCNFRNGTGCAERKEPHCILNVTVEKMLEGYELLTKCIKEKRTHALLLK